MERAPDSSSANPSPRDAIALSLEDLTKRLTGLPVVVSEDCRGEGIFYGTRFVPTSAAPLPLATQRWMADYDVSANRKESRLAFCETMLQAATFRAFLPFIASSTPPSTPSSDLVQALLRQLDAHRRRKQKEDTDETNQDGHPWQELLLHKDIMAEFCALVTHLKHGVSWFTYCMECCYEHVVQRPKSHISRHYANSIVKDSVSLASIVCRLRGCSSASTPVTLVLDPMDRFLVDHLARIDEEPTLGTFYYVAVQGNSPLYADYLRIWEAPPQHERIQQRGVAFLMRYPSHTVLLVPLWVVLAHVRMCWTSLAASWLTYVMERPSSEVEVECTGDEFQRRVQAMMIGLRDTHAMAWFLREHLMCQTPLFLEAHHFSSSATGVPLNLPSPPSDTTRALLASRIPWQTLVTQHLHDENVLAFLQHVAELIQPHLLHMLPPCMLNLIMVCAMHRDRKVLNWQTRYWILTFFHTDCMLPEDRVRSLVLFLCQGHLSDGDTKAVGVTLALQPPRPSWYCSRVASHQKKKTSTCYCIWCPHQAQHDIEEAPPDTPWSLLLGYTTEEWMNNIATQTPTDVPIWQRCAHFLNDFHEACGMHLPRQNSVSHPNAYVTWLGGCGPSHAT